MVEPSGADRASPESFLHIPLVRHALSDRQVRWTPRAIDCSWQYEGVAPFSVVGFNPFSKRIFYGAKSRLARWLRAPTRSARSLNAGDFLASELLFAVHDYLHVWAYLAICHLEPRLGFGTAPITRERFEDFAFCHIVTEAAATVGLDYWYLCTIRLNEVVPIGTRMRGPLTVDYHEEDGAEFRRFAPDLNVQSPAFFARLVQAYCDGTFAGFDARDVDRSPMLLRWMRHELGYARTQRVGIRAWLAYMSGEISLDASAEGAPITVTETWKKRLVSRVGALLWAKVKEGVLHRFAPALSPRDTWRSPTNGSLDYRFLNARAIAPRGENLAPKSFRWLAWQVLCAHELRTVDTRALALLDVAIEREDLALLAFLLGRARQVPMQEPEVRELYMPN